MIEQVDTLMPAEARALAALHHQAFEPVMRSWSADEFLALSQRDTCLVVRHGPRLEPQALAVLQIIAPEAELLTLATDPQHQRSGLGRSLLRYCEDTLTTLGVEMWFLEVAADNRPALVLYDKAGFKREHVRRGYYKRSDGSSVDAITMKRALSSENTISQS